MPATPRHTSRARIEAKESSILDAAEKIFAQAGFDGAKVSEIARAASVAEGTVYLYYKNKPDHSKNRISIRCVSTSECLVTSCSVAWTGGNSPRTRPLGSCATFSLAHWNFQRAR